MSLPSSSSPTHQGLLRTSYRSIFLGARHGVAAGGKKAGGLAGKGLSRASWPGRSGYPTAHRVINHPTRPRTVGWVTGMGGC